MQASFLQQIIDSIIDGIIAIDQNGTITHFNQTAARITGVSPQKAIGQYAKNILPDSTLPIVLQTGVPEIDRYLTLPGNQRIIVNRLPVSNQEGDIIGAISVFRDITTVSDLADQNNTLMEMQSLLEAIINASQNAISVVDDKGYGLIINPAYSQMTGLTEEDVIGKPADIDIAKGKSVHMRVLKTHKPIRGAHLKIKPHFRDVLVNAAPIIVDNELKGSVAIIHDISELQKLSEELTSAKRLIRSLAAKYSFSDIIGNSEHMRTAVKWAQKASEVPATVLLRGESGTGKELFAHAIHQSSDRKNNQFIRVNCASVVESLFESELFGYEEGSFTGAKQGGKKGLFEEAHNGTLFFDEVFELSLNTQAKLLRVLQEKEITRVGGSKALPVNVRVIAATHVNLEEAVQANHFRQDLYYRLNVMPIVIPPLRHRKEDIKELSFHIIKKLNQDFGRNILTVNPKTIKILSNYPWYGNVRELENVLAQSITKMKYNETEIHPDHLPELDRSLKNKSNISPQLSENQEHLEGFEPIDDLKTVLSRVEKEHILKVLGQSKWRKTETARKLGISIRNLYVKIEKYDIGIS